MCMCRKNFYVFTYKHMCQCRNIYIYIYIYIHIHTYVCIHIDIYEGLQALRQTVGDVGINQLRVQRLVISNIAVAACWLFDRCRRRRRRRHGGHLLPLLLLPLLLVLLLHGCFASMCVTMTKLRGLTQPKAASPKFRTPYRKHPYLTCKHQTASPKPSPAPPKLKLGPARAWKPPSPNPSIIEAPAISNGIPYISLLLLRHKLPFTPILSIKAFILNAYCSRHSLALY